MRTPRMEVLVVGGAGYIGSHMVLALLEAGHTPVVFDNLSTGHRRLVPKNTAFIKGDLGNFKDIDGALRKHKVGAVMHFAASSLVGESMKDPLKYYQNNVSACIELLKAMKKNGVKHFIFSSTAATYGEPGRVPIREEDPTRPVNPYGRSKLMIESMLKDMAEIGKISYVVLRYFNACGADRLGRAGEIHDPETHLIPNVLRAAGGGQAKLRIFGDDYKTPDGTCLRDYIHVEDLARAHLAALEALRKGMKSDVFNLGHGKGYSVLEIVRAVEKVTGGKVRYRIYPRRPGDPARLIADPHKAGKILKWKARIGLDEIVRSAWRWECARSDHDVNR